MYYHLPLTVYQYVGLYTGFIGRLLDLILVRVLGFGFYPTWMDTAMHDMGSQGHTLQIDLPRDWANLALYRDVWRGVVSRC